MLPNLLSHLTTDPLVGVNHYTIDIESPLRVINMLIVDDSATCRMMIKRTIEDLQIEGCRIHVDEASDGKNALKMMNKIMRVNDEDSTYDSLFETPAVKNKPTTANKVNAEAVYDLILMDYQMPKMDGPTAISHIRALGYQGRIVGLTGNVVETEMNKMYSSGADKVLTKPVNETQFKNIFVDLEL